MQNIVKQNLAVRKIGRNNVLRKVGGVSHWIICPFVCLPIPGRQTKRHPEKGGKLNTSQAGSVAASMAAVSQFLSIYCEAFILRTR